MVEVTFGTPLLPGITRDANDSTRLEECDGEEGEMEENMGSGLRMKYAPTMGPRENPR